ncbi:MAG: bifunctional oligoribonuclease/PAP phosphatase NrnA [Lachnospiraceae bacterium]|nr:bifunctional oligoribonuclease/PAP phosphatase NrnA [Lachnospiraceae bacterium]
MNSLKELLNGIETVGIAGHVKPDGDCVGSCLGVAGYIEDNFPKIKARVFLESVPEVFRFLRGAERVETGYPELPPLDLFIVLDCGDERRLGRALPYFKAAEKTACIDHHVSNESFAGENLVVPDASSTCELVYELMEKDRVSEKTAEALYTGIVHDTGVFQYSCTKKRTMEIAGDLMEKGIPYSRIVNDTFFQKTMAENRLLGTALLKSRLHANGRIISAFLTKEDFESAAATPKDTEGIVAQLRNTKGTEAAILLYRNEEGRYKLSLRSTELVDCAAICLKYGGGGHVRAAGATVEGDPEELCEKIVGEMERYLDYFEGQNLTE